MTIFDVVTSKEIASYWETLAQDMEPYPAQELFPNEKKMDISLSWIKGSKGLPAVLKVSAYDVGAIPRPRMGFERLSAEMPYFKESHYIDEELRKELIKAIANASEAYVDAITTRIFDDETSLIESASASRERMRMMALTTGIVSMANNGQTFSYDYGVTHKGNASVSWETHETADPMEDIRNAIEKVYDDTGAVITRAMCDRKVWRDLRNNEKIKKEIFVLTNGVGAISDNKLHQYLMDELGIDVRVNSKRYKDENGNTTSYMPDKTFVMFPDGALGNTWFGATPAETDLVNTSVANVSIVDTGVAITTVQHADPVNVETIVSQVCLPSFPMADQVFILDTDRE